MSTDTASEALAGRPMRERPVLFSAPMVRAVLANTKTQTRRAMRDQPGEDDGDLLCGHYHPTVVRRGEEEPGPQTFGAYSTDGRFALPCPYGAPGDRLWVRETLKPWTQDPELMAYAADDSRVSSGGYNYPTRCGDRVLTHVPSIHLHRCWSRITLEVTEVRVERLQDISEADARAEGIADLYAHADTNPCGAYAALWESINGAGSWEANPWVWCVSFRRVEAR